MFTSCWACGNSQPKDVCTETCLANARDILLALEQCHQRSFGTQLTLGHMAEVFPIPRAPYRGSHLLYDLSALPSGYVADDIESFRRLRRTKT